MTIADIKSVPKLDALLPGTVIVNVTTEQGNVIPQLVKSSYGDWHDPARTYGRMIYLPWSIVSFTLAKVVPA